jgi:hypothetical protein
MLKEELTPEEQRKPVEPPKDLSFYLPLGVLGNPAVTEPCPVSLVQLRGELSGCPPSSRVGTVLVMILNHLGKFGKDPTGQHPLFSMAPEKGHAAEFAFGTNGLTFFIYANVVRHDGAYMVRVSTPGVEPGAALTGLIATFYGDIKETVQVNGEEFPEDRGAFLTNPSNCGESATEREATVETDSWQNPGKFITERLPALAAVSGCEMLGFSAALSVKPQTTQADEPSGYELGFQFPQAPDNAVGLGTPPLKDTTIKFPSGTTISPSAANGLLACQETGPSGINIEGVESEAVAADGLEQPVAGKCPVGSELGSVSAKTPLLREELHGHLFLAAPGCGGASQPACTEEDAENGVLYGLYLELQGPESGVIVKLKGKTSVNPKTGQITADFEENPQFPLSSLTVAMNGGPRAPLANPQACGVARTEGRLTSWGEPFTAEVTPSDYFTVDWNGAGEPCPNSAPFSPSMVAGTSSSTAGATSPFSLTIKREDREQNIQSLSSTLPEGLLALVSKVTKCPEPLASQASLEACPTGSQIGTTTVAVGSGSDPYYVTGKVFFTGPYGGGPFGLSVVVPAAAGPFNLGNVLVRVALLINPRTAQVTAVSSPFPQILDGVPLRIRSINVTLDKQEFTLNPTSCAQMSIAGTLQSTTGAAASVSSPFAASGCKNLGFKPVVSIATQAKSTKANGTRVTVKITNPAGAEANLAQAVIGFPRQLPVRLETLQKACRAVVFEANPAACPAASDIGTTTVHTPILSAPLIGPVYLVSYGSAKFPDVVLLLQGEGVTLEADGQSFVSHTGALRVTFASVPDAPFSSLETVLPAGQFSQFTSVKSSAQAKSSQCGENLLAPLALTGHNGAALTETTKLQITGCPPSVSIVKAAVSGGTLAVTVKTSASGRLKISGSGLRTLVKGSLAAGTHKLTVALTGAGRQAARAHKKIQVNVGLVAAKKKASTRKKVTL